MDLPIHDLGNFEGSQMQLIGDFYTSLGVEQILHKIGAIIILPSLF
jgi:hypothetical protein